MTAAQLRKLLDTAGLSQRGAAKLIEINERTMRKYIAGEAEIPKTVEYALRWVINHLMHHPARQQRRDIR